MLLGHGYSSAGAIGVDFASVFSSIYHLLPVGIFFLFLSDEWMMYYNYERVHSGRYCYGKTLMQTFYESLTLARQKLIGQVTPAA